MRNFVFAFISFLAWAFLSAMAHQKFFSVTAALNSHDSIINTQSEVSTPIYKDTFEIKKTKIDSVFSSPIVKTYLSTTIFYGVKKDNFKEINKIDSLLKVLKLTLLNNYDAHIFIEGHTDSIGQTDANYLTGLEHANNFKDYLSSHGIEALRIETASKGELAPKYENSLTEHFKNRRLEITVKTFKNKNDEPK